MPVALAISRYLPLTQVRYLTLRRLAQSLSASVAAVATVALHNTTLLLTMLVPIKFQQTDG